MMSPFGDAGDGLRDDDESDHESFENFDFSEDSMRALRDRLNGMLGLSSQTPPLDDATADQTHTTVGSRAKRVTSIPFIDQHFPLRKRRRRSRKDVEEALAALDELAKSMQDELTKAVENVPKIELDVSEDDEGYIVVCSSTTDAFDDRVEILLEEGVLGLVLPATQGIQMVLPIVRMPADATGEIMDVEHAGTTLTIKVAKEAGVSEDATRATGVPDAKAHASNALDDLTGEATRDPERFTYDPTSTPQEIKEGEFLSEYLAKQRAGTPMMREDDGAAEEDDDGEAEATRDSGPNV